MSNTNILTPEIIKKITKTSLLIRVVLLINKKIYPQVEYKILIEILYADIPGNRKDINKYMKFSYYVTSPIKTLTDCHFEMLPDSHSGWTCINLPYDKPIFNLDDWRSFHNQRDWNRALPAMAFNTTRQISLCHPLLIPEYVRLQTIFELRFAKPCNQMSNYIVFYERWAAFVHDQISKLATTVGCI